MKPFSNAAEREKLEQQANLFAILRVLEALEVAFARNIVRDADYEVECQRLLGQQKLAYEMVKADIREDLEGFAREYDLKCESALLRIKEGHPGTAKYAPAAAEKEGTVKIASSAAVLLVTILDTLSLDRKAKDEIFPPLGDLQVCLKKLTNFPQDSPTALFVEKWIAKFNRMQAHEELNPEELRSMIFETEQAQKAFMDWLR